MTVRPAPSSARGSWGSMRFNGERARIADERGAAGNAEQVRVGTVVGTRARTSPRPAAVEIVGATRSFLTRRQILRLVPLSCGCFTRLDLGHRDGQKRRPAEASRPECYSRSAPDLVEAQIPVRRTISRASAANSA